VVTLNWNWVVNITGICMNIANQTAGIYFVQFIADNGIVTTRKIIKK
jgi:hypothetical protein